MRKIEIAEMDEATINKILLFIESRKESGERTAEKIIKEDYKGDRRAYVKAMLEFDSNIPMHKTQCC